jgi:hypothetical protein
MLCLRADLDGHPNKLLTAIRLPVVEARNQLAREARELDPERMDFDPKYVLSIDDDAWWPAGHVDRAMNILEENPPTVSREPSMERIGGHRGTLGPFIVYGIFGATVREPGELVEMNLCAGIAYKFAIVPLVVA